ncbi:MAG: hypothetical protein ACFCAD_18485 [Pleurocapsa sp.]
MTGRQGDWETRGLGDKGTNLSFIPLILSNSYQQDLVLVNLLLAFRILLETPEVRSRFWRVLIGNNLAQITNGQLIIDNYLISLKQMGEYLFLFVNEEINKQKFFLNFNPYALFGYTFG